MRLRRLLLCGLLSLLLPWSSLAATRLGLHVTDEELVQWRARRTSSATIGGLQYQTIYNNRILADANAFRSGSHPGYDGYWAGYTPAGCVPAGDETTWVPGRWNGLTTFKSALVFLLNNDPTDAAGYAAGVRTEILATVAAPGTDFSNGSKWCVSNTNPTNQFPIVPWIIRLLLAYDYLLAGGYTGFSATEKTNIQTWFSNAANFWWTITKNQVTQGLMSGAFNTTPNFTCDGPECGNNPIGVTHFGGFTVHGGTLKYGNQSVVGAILAAMVALPKPTMALQDATMQAQVKNYMQQYVQFALFSDSTVMEQYRWSDGLCGNPSCPGSAWGHFVGDFSAIQVIADLFGRTGDTSLYTYSSSNGMLGTSGGPKSMNAALLLVARMANGTVLRYGTGISSEQDAAHRIWNLAEAPFDNFGDLAGMVNNVWYKNNEVHTAMGRSETGNCADPGSGCWGLQNGLYPDLPFMWGNLDDGSINPYNVTPLSAAPVVTITAPTGTTYKATATPLTLLAGTTTDDVGVTGITWNCPTCTPTSGTICPGAQCGGTATTRTWTVPSIGLATGANMITVTGTDADSQTAMAVVRVLLGTPDVTSNRILYLPFNDGPGSTTADDIGTGNHDATLSVGTSWTTPGKVGAAAVHFADNSAQLVTVSGTQAYVTSATPFTFATWANLTSFTLASDFPVLAVLRSSATEGFQIFYSNDLPSLCYGVGFATNDAAFLKFRYLPATAAAMLGWHHLTLVYNGSGGTTLSNYTVYWDGEPVTLQSGVCGGGKAQQTTIGGYGGAAQLEDWQGDVDETMVYTRALSPVDVYELFSPSAAPANAPVLIRVIR